MDEKKTPIVRIDSLSVRFDNILAVEDVTLSVTKGEILALIGPNGSGKSVLLKAMLGLLPYTGSVTWEKGVRVNYVPQKLFVDKNLPLTVGEFFRIKTKDLEKTMHALSSVGIGDEYHVEQHLFSQRLATLSGGQFQRILIAWSLIGDPDVLVYDEPTAGVDAGGEETIYHYLEKLHKERSITIIMVSHDLHIIYRHAHKVICINKKKICDGVPYEVLDKDTLTNLYGHNVGVYHHDHD